MPPAASLRASPLLSRYGGKPMPPLCFGIRVLVAVAVQRPSTSFVCRGISLASSGNTHALPPVPSPVGFAACPLPAGRYAPCP